MSRDLTDSEIIEAEDEVLRDVDSLSNFICGECMNKPIEDFLPLAHDIDADRMTTQRLLAFAFDPGQLRDLRAQAIDTIARRFLDANKEAVLQIARRISDDKEAIREDDLIDRARDRLLEDA